VHFDRLLADAAYDAEHNHLLCRQELGIRSTVIPLNERGGYGPPKTKYRAQMSRRFSRSIYGQRWQVESAISRNKRLLGSAVRACTHKTQAQECLVRVLTHNLMILRLSPKRFSTEQLA
jgi:transposase